MQTALFKLSNLDEYNFDELPKGYLSSLVINPYNGKVFIKLEKHDASSQLALYVMRQIVAACNALENKGSKDPLKDLLEACDGENWCDFAPCVRSKIVNFSIKKGEGKAGAKKVKKIS